MCVWVCVRSENNLGLKYPACHRGSSEAKHGSALYHVNTHTEESAYIWEEIKTLPLFCLAFCPTELLTSKASCRV